MNALKLLKELEANFQKYVNLSFIHGTRSGVFYGMGKAGEVLPADKLIENGIPPFTGELMMGLGLSPEYISGFGPSHLNKVFYYSDQKSHWSPWMSRVEIDKFEDIFKGYSDAKIINEMAQKRLEIERMRLKAWPELSDMEKYFVRKEFPVVIGSFKKGEPSRKNIYSDGGEVGLNGIGIDEAILFVPLYEMRRVRRFFTEKDYDIDLHPIESLKIFAELQASLGTGYDERKREKRIREKLHERIGEATVRFLITQSVGLAREDKRSI